MPILFMACCRKVLVYRKERRILLDSDLPTPSWCPLRENSNKYVCAKLRTLKYYTIFSVRKYFVFDHDALVWKGIERPKTRS